MKNFVKLCSIVLGSAFVILCAVGFSAGVNKDNSGQLMKYSLEQGDYYAGVDFKMGEYTIYAEEAEMEIQFGTLKTDGERVSIKLEKGEKKKDVNFYEHEPFKVIGEGTVVLQENTPSKYMVVDQSYNLKDGSYKIGRDIQPGVYNVYAREGKVNVQFNDIEEGEVVYQMELLENFALQVEGNGYAEFIPVIPKKIVPDKDTYTLEVGSYYFPENFEPGEYELRLDYDKKYTGNLDKIKTTVEIWRKGTSSGECISMKLGAVKKIKLNAGDKLVINKTRFNSNKAVIPLMKRVDEK